MKTNTLMKWLAGVVVIACFCAGLGIAADENAPGLNRVPVLIGFKQVPGPAEQALVRSHGGEIKYSYTLVPGIAASVPEAAIEGLRRNPNVTVVEPDIEVQAVDAELDSAWGVKRIGAGVVHPTNTGAGVKVAVIDSGMDYNHLDLNGNYAGGYDFVHSDSDPMDDNGHGTHVAGTIGAEDDGVGVVGVAPSADLYALKVLGANGSGSYSAVIAALQWAVNNGMKVTNNSYGSSGDPGTLTHQAFDNAAAAGIINVCAAGNSGNVAGTGDSVIYPAKYTSCIAVAATDTSNTRASFSSTGPDVELAAPGVGITSTVPGGGYESWSGTSTACPHVTGTVALVIAAGVGGVRTRLQQTADDLGALGRDSLYGYGLVDADEAVAGGAPVDSPPIVALIAPPNGATVSGTVDIVAYPDDDNGITQVEFFRDGVSIGVDTASPYSLSWNSTSVSDGSHALAATATDTVGQTATDQISVTVNNLAPLPTMHVDSIVMSLKKTGPNVNAVATVTVVNGAGAPVVGATVSGRWSGTTGDSDVGTTDTLGRVALQSNKVKNPKGTITFTFTVTDVVKSGWTYVGGTPSGSKTVP